MSAIPLLIKVQPRFKREEREAGKRCVFVDERRERERARKV